MLKLATVAALLTAAALAAPASALTLLGATSVTVKSAVSSYIQVAELQAFQFGTGTNVALASNGGTATAASVWVDGPAVAGLAIDGVTIGDYPNLYHSYGPGAGEYLTITFAAPTSLSSLSIFGRNGCCKERDSYKVEVFNGTTSIYTGALDAISGSGTISFVPEPATWGLLLAGFGVVGVSMRRKSTAVAA